MLAALIAPLAQAEPVGLMAWVDRIARTPISQILIFAGALTALRLLLLPVLAKTPSHKRGGGFVLLRFISETADALVYAAVVVFLLVRPFGIQTFWIPSGSMIDTLLAKDFIVANKLVYRFWEPKAGDIVVFEPPRDAPGAESGNVDYIKRLIGEPGEVIEIRDRKLYRNGKVVAEDYVDFTSVSSDFTEVLPEADWKDALYPDFKLVQDGDKLVPVLISSDGLANFGLYTSLQGATTYSGSYPAQDEQEAARWGRLPAAKIPPDHYLFMGDNRNGSADGRFWGLVKRDKIVGRSEFIWLPLNRMRLTR